MEKDLFLPIKEYFEAFGYVCDGEVEDIDMYMEKAPAESKADPNQTETLAVELKQTLDFRAVQQAALRQKIVDNVFIGIFRPKDINSRSFKDKEYLLKRLGIGLIVVSKRTKAVEVVIEPVVCELASFKSHNKRKKDTLSAEFQKRRVKSNTGGVRGVKLITGYREDALLVLDALCTLHGEGSTSQVREISGVPNAASILYNNFYGWFLKVGRGVYSISDTGYDALEEFENTLKALMKKDSL